MSESLPHLEEVGTLASYAGLGSTWNELDRLICWYIQLAEWEDGHPQTLRHTVTKTQKHTITNRDTEAQMHRHKDIDTEKCRHRLTDTYINTHSSASPCDKCCGGQGGLGKSSQRQA